MNARPVHRSSEAAAERTRFSGLHALWPALLIFVGLVICHAPALRGEKLWDDDAHLTSPELQTFHGLVQIWTNPRATQQYYPVIYTAFWLEHRLWGDHLIAYHLINLVWQSLSCSLLVALLRASWKFARDPVTDNSDENRFAWGLAWLAASLFAFHPLSVESLAWISEQKNTLSLVFYLAAALLYIKYSRSRRTGLYIVAFVLFCLAVGAKSVTATLPAALLVLLWWQQGSLNVRRDVVPLLPWFCVALAGGLTTVWIERHYVGAQGAAFQLSLIERALLASRVVAFYFQKLLWPAHLAFFYHHWDVPRLATSWWPFAAGIGMVTAVLWYFRKKMAGLLAGWLLFVGSLFPALGFFNVFPFKFSYVADHFQYLASLSLIATLVGVVGAFATRRPGIWRSVALGALGVALVAEAWASHRLSANYASNVALFRATIAETPDSWMAHHILGIALSKEGAPDEAAAELRRAVALNPDFPDAHLALGVVLTKQPAFRAEGIQEYQTAIRLRPEYAEAHNNLGFELERVPGNTEAAIAEFRRALELKPGLAEARANLARALSHLPGHQTEAAREYERALLKEPDNASLHAGYAYVLSQISGQENAAYAEFKRGLELNPNDAEAHYHLGNLYARSPRTLNAAIAEFETSLRLRPEVAETEYNLANALAFTPDRWNESISHYEAAIRLRPDLADAHANLANVLSRIPERTAEAIAENETALKIDDSRAWIYLNLAWLLARSPERVGQAAAEAEAALRLQPKYVEAMNCLAICDARLGRIDEARAWWTKALEIAPDFTAARENLARLEAGPPVDR